jgi:hypothetical protein
MDVIGAGVVGEGVVGLGEGVVGLGEGVVGLGEGVVGLAEGVVALAVGLSIVGFFVGVVVGAGGVLVALVVEVGREEVVEVAVAVGVEVGSKITNGGNTADPSESPDGVKNVSHQLIGVRISFDTGGTTIASSFADTSGSRKDFISPSTAQRGAMRMASCPTHNIITTPIGKIKTIRLQSLLLLFGWGVFMMHSPIYVQWAGK